MRFLWKTALAVAFGTVIAAGAGDGAEEGRETRDEFSGAIWKLFIAGEYAQLGQTLAAGCAGDNLDEPGIFSIWHGTPAQPTTVDSKTPQNGLLTVLFSPDDRLVAGSGADEAVYFWEVATGRLQTTIYPLHGVIRDLAFSPDGKRLVVVADRGITSWATPLSGPEGRRR